MLDRPFRALDQLEFDIELPPLPRPLGRIDAWFDRLSELQRVGFVLLVMLFLAASSLYCLGLGSTVLVNRKEEEVASAPPESTLAPLLPTSVPSPTEVPAALPMATVPVATLPPARTTAPATPIPAQALPTVQQQAAPGVPADSQQAPRPRIVAPPEPPTPYVAPGQSGGTSVRPGTAAPALAPTRAGTGVFATPTPSGVRPPATVTPRTGAPASTVGPAPTSGPAAKPTTAPAAKPASGSLFQPTPYPTAASGPAAPKPTAATGPTPKPIIR